MHNETDIFYVQGYFAASTLQANGYTYYLCVFKEDWWRILHNGRQSN